MKSNCLHFPHYRLFQQRYRRHVLEPPGLVLVHPSGDARRVAAREGVLPVYPDGGRTLYAEADRIVVVDGPIVDLGLDMQFRKCLIFKGITQEKGLTVQAKVKAE